MSKYYRELFEKFLKHDIAPDELDQLLSWINQHEEFEDVSVLEKIWVNLETSEAIDRDKALRIQSKLRTRIQEVKSKENVRKLNPWWLRIAAALILAIIGASGILYYLNTPVVVKTEFGEIVEVALPDQSRVRLNANSQIRYTRRWNSQEVRTIWLDGEAFFAVTKDLKDHKKFVVNTRDLSVEVLGTEFNVSTRDVATRVFLETGSVKLSSLDGRDSLKLVPGEVAGFDDHGTLTKLKRVEVRPPTDWKDGSMVLKDRPLSEILREYEIVFGENFTLSDTQLLDQSFTVIFPITDHDKALEILKNLTGNPIEIEYK